MELPPGPTKEELLARVEAILLKRGLVFELPPGLTEEELLARMEEILLRLPRLTSEVFLSHRVDKLTYAQIAQRTGLTVPQVKRRMARALLALSRALDPDPRPWWKFW